MGPIILLLAAFIFIVDAAFLFGKADPKGAGVANVAVGVIMNTCGLQLGFTAGGNSFLMILCGLTMAFSLFYIVLGWCLLAGYDLKALGWLCLGAALFTLLSAVFFFGLGTTGNTILGIFALTWATLFATAWLNLAFGTKWAGFLVKWILVVDSLITLMIPAYLLITGGWPA